jgi:histidinol-phosphatase
VNDRDPLALLNVAHEICDETDGIALRYFAAEVTATSKADATLVTVADTEIEERIRGRLATAYPDHGLVGEEFGVERQAGEARWIIDPIDGTHNFVRGIPVFATLLALERAGSLVLGIVSAPALGHRWFAAAGHGAHVRSGGRERPIRVSTIDRLAEAQLCFSTVRRLDEIGLLRAWLGVIRGSWRDRGFGDFWGHVLVAQGSAEAMLEHGVHPWDLAAPSAIVTEAGGRMTDLEGKPSWSGPGVLTTNGALHARLVDMLRAAIGA